MKGKNRLIPKIGIAAFSSPLEVGANKAAAAATAFADKFTSCDCEVINLGVVQSMEDSRKAGMRLYDERVDVLLAVPVCWYEDYLIIDLLEEWHGPLFLWPLPGIETGALCGAQQNMSFLKKLEHPTEHAFGEVDNKKCFEKAMKFFRAAALNRIMRRSKIGLAGHRIPGMTHTFPDEFTLKKSIGARVVHLDLPEILAGIGKEAEEKAGKKWNELVLRAGCCNVSEADGIYSMQMYSILKKTIDEKELNALAVGCYPQLMGKVCLAASLLADEGTPMACEGDVNGAVAMLIMSLLSNGAVHNCDWLEPVEEDTVLFTHCGSGSFSLAEKKEDIKLESVRLMGQGVCAQFPSKPGPVTLLNLTPGENSYLCAVLEGEAVKTEMLFPGNPLQVRFTTSPTEINDWIFNNGLGHHWMAAYGHYSQEIIQWNRICGKTLKIIEIT
jgi:L-fucose isomerase-like protein